MSIFSAEAQKQFENELIKAEHITREDLVTLKRDAESANMTFSQYILDKKIIDNEAFTKIVALVSKVPYVNLNTIAVPVETLNLLPKEIAERYMAVPIGEVKGRLAVAMLDANNVQAADFLSQKIGRPITVYMGSEPGIQKVINQYKSDLEVDVTDVLDKDEKSKEQLDKNEVKTIVQDSPISKALSAILEYSVQNRASDIHIEPREHEVKIRSRIDGILSEIMTLPKSIEPALISRIKILSNLKIDEHRIPQDGQFKVMAVGKEIDLRISIAPIVWGEQVVIRILDKSGSLISLEGLGFTGDALRAIREGLKRPNGMILSSGPTGSGKSTTLYALIKEIISEEVNIVTLEDPVEYQMDGVNQIQVNPAVGLTFASGLRSILRQDPNVVMVGEIRDKETAQLAIQAALTGHLVFSTLHTNSAAGVLPRLIDMGVEPFLIASTVNTVIAQRLVRRNDTESLASYNATPAGVSAIQDVLGEVLPKNEAEVSEISKYHGYERLPIVGQNAYTLYKGLDPEKDEPVYKGRMGIYEVFSVRGAIEELVVNRATSTQIQEAAQKNGMLTMRQDGYMKALSGLTTIDEVNRVTSVS